MSLHLQAWYICFERVRHPDRNAHHILARYAPSLDEVGARAAAVNPAWFARYVYIYIHAYIHVLHTHTHTHTHIETKHKTTYAHTQVHRYLCA